jgi:hypothetical protein
VGGIERGLEVVLIFAIAVLGPSLILAAGGYASIQALGRNPSAAPKIFTAMIILLIWRRHFSGCLTCAFSALCTRIIVLEKKNDLFSINFHTSYCIHGADSDS